MDNYCRDASAVTTYHFLFESLLNISNTKNKTELVEKKELKTTLSFITNSKNALRTTITKSYFDDGMVVSETKKIRSTMILQKTIKPETQISKSLNGGDYWKMVLIVFIMIVYVTMVYGPIAAFLVELFPTKIRYTSMSLPYHIGNGVFGGLTPFFATLLTTIYTGDKLVGLMYPIIVASICIFICLLYVNNKNNFSFDND